MRRIHAGHVVLDFLPPPWRRALARRMQEGAGLAVILAAALLGASLASWSIADPSLNHATGAPVRNLLGRPGAFLADPLMQALGLAAAAHGPRRLCRRRAPGLPDRLGSGADRPLGRVRRRRRLWRRGHPDARARLRHPRPSRSGAAAKAEAHRTEARRTELRRGRG